MTTPPLLTHILPSAPPPPTHSPSFSPHPCQAFLVSLGAACSLDAGATQDVTSDLFSVHFLQSVPSVTDFHYPPTPGESGIGSSPPGCKPSKRASSRETTTHGDGDALKLPGWGWGALGGKVRVGDAAVAVNGQGVQSAGKRPVGTRCTGVTSCAP